jgi:hypothetical protein
MTIEQAEAAHKVRQAFKGTESDLKELSRALGDMKRHLSSPTAKEIIDWSATQIEKALYNNEQDYKNTLAEIN